jgi:hypothetical protein
MKTLVKAVSVVCVASLILISPGFGCWQAVAGIVETQGMKPLVESFVATPVGGVDTPLNFSASLGVNAANALQPATLPEFQSVGAGAVVSQEGSIEQSIGKGSSASLGVNAANALQPATLSESQSVGAEVVASQKGSIEQSIGKKSSASVVNTPVTTQAQGFTARLRSLARQISLNSARTWRNQFSQGRKMFDQQKLAPTSSDEASIAGVPVTSAPHTTLRPGMALVNSSHPAFIPRPAILRNAEAGIVLPKAVFYSLAVAAIMTWISLMNPVMVFHNAMEAGLSGFLAGAASQMTFAAPAQVKERIFITPKTSVFFGTILGGIIGLSVYAFYGLPSFLYVTLSGGFTGWVMAVVRDRSQDAYLATEVHYLKALKSRETKFGTIFPVALVGMLIGITLPFWLFGAITSKLENMAIVANQKNHKGFVTLRFIVAMVVVILLFAASVGHGISHWPL